MIATTGEPGAILADRLGIHALRNEGHDLVAACIACDSSDGFRVHRESGVAQCYTCKAKFSRLKLAETVLGDQRAAWQLLEEVGLEQPRPHNGNGHAAPANPLEAIARAKRIPLESLKAFGAKAVGNDRVAIPCYGADGKQCGTLTIWTHGTEKQVKGLLGKGDKAGVYLMHNPDGSPRLPQAGEVWHGAEGPKDPAALHGLGLLAFGYNGSSLPVKLARLFRGVDAVLAPDRDTAGINGADKSARVLAGSAASIKIATLPAEMKDKGGDDVRDILRREGGREQVLQAIADAQEWKSHADDRPEIVITTDEARVADELIAALQNAPNVYQRSGRLVQVVRDDQAPKGINRQAAAPRVAALPEASIREKAATVARFIVEREGKDGLERRAAHPPAWCIKAVEARGEYRGVPYLHAVVESPVLRADGSVLQTPGYCPDTGILYQPNAVYPPIPENPSSREAIDAAAALLEVFADFPFETDEHRSAAVAAVLTPFGRQAIVGPCPLMLVDANVRGSGKNLLMDSIGEICYGRPMARMPAPSHDEEFRKRISSVAFGAVEAVLLDNVAGTLGCQSLDSALTSTVWTDRVLGLSETATAPLLAIWFATANNAILGADTARRTLHIRFSSNLENPEERDGFKYPDLLKWVREERPRLVAAALTILRAFCAAGMPSQGLPRWGSFEAWSDLIRQAVVWVGLPDPGATRAKLADTSDSEANFLRLMLDGWEEMDEDASGMLVSDVLNRLAADTAANRWKALREALAMLPGVKAGSLPTTRSVGMKLHHLRGRIAGGKRFSRRNSRDGAIWSVQATT